MIKLLDILKEIVEGKAIEVPETELNKIDKLYVLNLKDILLFNQ